MISELKRAEDEFWRWFLLDNVSPPLCRQAAPSQTEDTELSLRAVLFILFITRSSARRDEFISAAIMSDIYWW